MFDNVSEATKYHKVSFIKKIQHVCELFFLLIFWGLFKIIGYHYSVSFVRYVSNIMGFIPRLKRRALYNVALVYPEKTVLEQEVFVKKTWANLGNIIIDCLFIRYLVNQHDFYKIEGLEKLQILQKQHESILFFSGHNASWEIFRIVAYHHDIDVAMIYRAFNNPYIDYLARYCMNYGSAPVFQKGNVGVKRMMRHLKNKGNILILTDQHFSKGLNIPFLGHCAKTAPSVAEISLKYHIPLVPIFVRRDGIGRFIVSVQDPLDTNSRTEDTKIQTVTHILTQMNKVLENHIRTYPEEWFWLHKRWK